MATRSQQLQRMQDLYLLFSLDPLYSLLKLKEASGASGYDLVRLQLFYLRHFSVEYLHGNGEVAKVECASVAATLAGS